MLFVAVALTCLVSKFKLVPNCLSVQKSKGAKFDFLMCEWVNSSNVSSLTGQMGNIKRLCLKEMNWTGQIGRKSPKKSLMHKTY